MIGSNRVRTRPFTRLQEHALATKHELPLTTANSNYVQLFYNQAEYSLGLYERASDVEPRFIAKLRDASIVNNTTEKGPCLFLICKNGHFEFQTTGKEMFSDWLQTFKDCGIPLIPFSQLYKVQKSVGEGSFAKVYLARHMYTNQEVCIKAIDKGRVQTSNVYTEIEVLRKVAHPYINRLFAAYENDKTICLVLEYLKGGELFEYLSKKGPYNEIHAKLAFRRILSGLNCLHRKGIVHRDLKTENLILEEENSPTSLKIIDFGLASTLGSPTMTMRCGSPGYVAPEILQEMPYGIKVDLFSAGVILYTVLGGYPPFRGANIREILKANVRCKVSFNHPRWNPVSQYAKDLILWMTNKNADCRCSATQALGHPWFEGVPQSLPQSVPSRASETYAIVPARAPKKVVVVAKKAAVPEVGSASTCASPGGSGLSPFSAEATSSTASNAQQSNHPRPVAAANVAAVAAAAAGGHAGKTTPYLPQTVTTNGVHSISGGYRACTGHCTENSFDESTDVCNVSALKRVSRKLSGCIAPDEWFERSGNKAKWCADNCVCSDQSEVVVQRTVGNTAAHSEENSSLGSINGLCSSIYSGSPTTTATVVHTTTTPQALWGPCGFESLQPPCDANRRLDHSVCSSSTDSVTAVTQAINVCTGGMGTGSTNASVRVVPPYELCRQSVLEPVMAVGQFGGLGFLPVSPIVGDNSEDYKSVPVVDRENTNTLSCSRPALNLHEQRESDTYTRAVNNRCTGMFDYSTQVEEQHSSLGNSGVSALRTPLPVAPRCAVTPLLLHNLNDPDVHPDVHHGNIIKSHRMENHVNAATVVTKSRMATATRTIAQQPLPYAQPAVSRLIASPVNIPFMANGAERVLCVSNRPVAGQRNPTIVSRIVRPLINGGTRLQCS
eukprot:Lankesteria_metandrocarpae@DN5427_c1_g1_i6.p1